MRTRKKVVAILMLISISLFNFSFALADGMMVMPAQDEYAWDKLIGDKADPSMLPAGIIVGENSQQAFISWDGGKKIEKMMIVVDKENVNRRKSYSYGYMPQNIDKLYWIVPVKSDCRDVKPYHYEKFSNSMDVISVNDESKNRLKTMKEIVYGMQIWPLVGMFTKLSSTRQPVYYENPSRMQTWGMKGANIEPDVTVYREIESYGVKTEILSADSFDGLERYLADNYVRLDSNARNVIESYISGDYCFAVSSVTSPNEKGKLGIMLEFKTLKPFYPLYISSASKSNNMRVEIFASGAMDANMGRSSLATQSYYLKNNFYYGKDDEILFKKGAVLTNIVMSRPASSFTSDIYFNESIVGRLAAEFKLNYWLVMLAAYFAVSFVLGFLIFKKGWVKAGILNFLLGLLGVLAGVVLPHYLQKNTVKAAEAANAPALPTDEKLRLVKSFRIGNKLVLALPIVMLFLVTMAIFGGYGAQRFLEGIIDWGVGNGGFALAFFIFMLPLSFMLGTLFNIIRKILESKKIDLAMKEFLLGLMAVVNNALETVLVAVSVIMFIAMGPNGWIVGVITALILLWSLSYGRNDEKIMRKVLGWMPFIFLFFLLFGLFAAIASMVILYQYLVNHYSIGNAKDITPLYESMSESAKAPAQSIPERFQNASLLGKVAMYSVLLVSVYAVLDWIVETVLI